MSILYSIYPISNTSKTRIGIWSNLLWVQPQLYSFLFILLSLSLSELPQLHTSGYPRLVILSTHVVVLPLLPLLEVVLLGLQAHDRLPQLGGRVPQVIFVQT